MILLARDAAIDVELVWNTGAGHYGLSFLLALGSSGLLARFYRSLPVQWLSGAKSIVVVGLSCLLAGAMWNTGVCVHLLLMTHYPAELTRVWAVQGTLFFAKVLLAWSVLYLLILHAKRSAQLRYRGLQSDTLTSQATLQSLRLQLNRAFFFNAIDSVSDAMGRDPERARSLLREATGILRCTLNATRSDFSTLGNELDFEARYLRCEAMRLHDSLTYRVNTPEALRNVPIPSLLIHSVVEDVVARFAGQSGASHVEIGARLTSGRLEIDVRRRRSPNEDVSVSSAGPLTALRGQISAAYPDSGSVAVLADDSWSTTRIGFDPTEPSRSAEPASEAENGNVGLGHEGRAETRAHDTTVLRQPRLWLLPACAGLAIYVTAFTNGSVDWVDDGAAIGELVKVHGFGLALAVACCAILGGVWCRVSRIGSTRRSALRLLAWSCPLVCLLWTVAMGSAFMNTGLTVADERSVLFLDLLLLATLICLVSVGSLLLASSGRRLRDAWERFHRSEALAYRAQFLALRAQLNPHFLFNALNSVVPMIQLNRPLARRMLSDLKQLMRRALDTTRTGGATFGEELDFVSQYLRCEATRFGDFVSFEVHVPDRLLGAPVPSMLLQPLVENAIKHGMAKEMSSLCVELSAATVGQRLVLEVRNTGVLRVQPRRDDAPDGDLKARAGLGTGLRIVRERLANRYPTTGSFELCAQDGWVVARITYDPSEGDEDLSGDAVQLPAAAS